jgi:hypothetical protein
MAKPGKGARAHSRKRRPSKAGARKAAVADRGATEQPPRADRAGSRRRGAPPRPGSVLTDRLAVGERPRAPWHPLPLSELLILIGAIGTVVGLLRGESGIVLMVAGLGAVLIGTVEVTLREHLSGYRSHTILLAVIPAIVFHTAVVLLVLAFSGHVPRWLNVVLLPIDAAVFAVCFKLLRARFVDARRERTFAGRR